MMGLGAVIGLASAACGSTVQVEDGAGGAGGASASGVTSTSSSNKSTTNASSQNSSMTNSVTDTTMAVSTYGVGPSSSSTGGCDDGSPGELRSQTCEDCVACAFGSSCAAEYAAFLAEPDAQAVLDCDAACDGLPCLDNCAAPYPEAINAYITALSCAVCIECPNNCDAANNCI